ncbi:unnamed protein product [Soboliphyme baturini]|uniref:NOT2_3_5 domain-containing protein n=1 Tax=Soboliphyme baturini TaxID=241478 RepID=A0A183IAD0_9BILA|nr:unnamed protein product [Soboliphyme baturini]
MNTPDLIRSVEDHRRIDELGDTLYAVYLDEDIVKKTFAVYRLRCLGWLFQPNTKQWVKPVEGCTQETTDGGIYGKFLVFDQNAWCLRYEENVFFSKAFLEHEINGQLETK